MPRGTNPRDAARIQKQLWTPQTFQSRVQIWLDASDPATIVAASGTVSEWKDKSLRHVKMAQATGVNQPTYTQNGINGRAALTFGASIWMASDTGTFDTGPDEHAVYVVGTMGSGSGTIGRLFGFVASGEGDVTGSNSAGLCLRFGAQERLSCYNATDLYGSYVDIAYDTPFLYSWRSDGGASQTWNLGTAGTAGDWGRTLAASGRFIIGCTGESGASTATRYLAGMLGEVIVTRLKTATANHEKFEGYLAHKWGLAGNLIASHRFKSSPPLIGH